MQFRFSFLATAGAVLLIATQAFAQTATSDFETPGVGGDQGWGSGFDGSGSGVGSGRTLPIVFENGSNYARVVKSGTGFHQETGYTADNSTPADPYYVALEAGIGDAANTYLDYDWYIDTSTLGAGAGTFLQGGSYVNEYSGYYAQNFPNSGKEIELNGTQLASGQVFSGHVHINFAAVGYAMNASNGVRVGLLLNGDGANQYVDYDNITISHVPEPSTFVLGGLTGLGLMVYRRRK